MSNSRVRGPTSALTEFLREKQIHIPNQNRFRRRNEEEASAAAIQSGAGAAAAEASAQAGPSSAPGRSSDRPFVKPPPRPKGKQPAAAPAKKAARAKLGNSMDFDESGEEDDEMEPPEGDDDEDFAPPSATKRKAAVAGGAKRKRQSIADDDDDDFGGDAADGDFDAHRPLAEVGSREECEKCGDMFSVTSFTTQTSSGALCNKCGKAPARKKAAPAKGKAKAKNATAARNAKKRIGVLGAGGEPFKLPTLQSLCIDLIAKHIEDVESLVGVGGQNMDTISKSISKNRRLNGQTVQLFLDNHARSLTFYDCSGLDSDALASIATFAPNVEVLNLQLCGRLDNDAMGAWARKLKALRSLELYGPYSVYVEVWHDFFDRRGKQLESFKIRESSRFDYGCCVKLVAQCPNLTELGLAQVGKLNGECLAVLHALKDLTYLDVSDPGVSKPGVAPESLQDDDVVALLEHVGEPLTFLDLGGNADLTSVTLLDGVLKNCRSLLSLRLSHCNHADITPAHWASLFSGFAKEGAAGLEKLNVERCLAFGDEALTALLKHSGHALRELNINSCNSLTSDALKGIAKYCPNLQRLDVGFCRAVDDGLLMDLCGEDSQCKALQRIALFGCNKVSDWVSSKRVRLVGMEKTVPL